MRRSVIFDVVLRGLAPVIGLVAVFLLVSGHNLPGGGFVAGLVASGILALFYVAQGRDGLTAVRIGKPVTLIGAGLTLAALSGLVPMLFGEAALTQDILHLRVPVFDEIKVPSSLLFDIGVFLVVFGAVAEALVAMSGREPAEDEGGSR